MAKNYKGMITSSIYTQADSKGWITTTTNPQTFVMTDTTLSVDYAVSNIYLEADTSNDVNISFNSERGFINIAAGDVEEITEFGINSITCKSAIGTKFRFRALAEKVFGR